MTIRARSRTLGTPGVHLQSVPHRAIPATFRLRDRRQSARGVLVAGEPPAPHRRDPALEGSLDVLAAGIEALGPADPEPAGGLVDVTVETDHRLVPLHRVADRPAAPAGRDEPPSCAHGPRQLPGSYGTLQL